MKILYLCPDFGIPVLGRKGASVHVRALVAAFARARHSVVVAAPVLTKSLWDEPSRTEGQLLHLPLRSEATAAVAALRSFTTALGVGTSLPGEMTRILHNAELAKQLRQRFAKNPPDFLYERASLYATAGVSVARELGRPLLLELNAPITVEQEAYRATSLGELAAEAERWLVSRADAVLAVSEPLRDYALSLGAQGERVHVVPNGVDAALFRPCAPDHALRARWGLGEGPLLGFVGGLRPWHGVESLPALLDRLMPRHPGLQLTIVGDGPLRGPLERELRERGLLERVIFTGALPHEEVAGVIRLLDVALAPYPRPEHDFYFSPLKLFEYMACGVPVVAAALGQIAEVVRDGETGLLYPPGDQGALAAACDRLLGDTALQSRLGDAAAREVHARFTWDHNAERVVNLAHSLGAGRASG